MNKTTTCAFPGNANWCKVPFLHLPIIILWWMWQNWLWQWIWLLQWWVDPPLHPLWWAVAAVITAATVAATVTATVVPPNGSFWNSWYSMTPFQRAIEWSPGYNHTCNPRNAPQNYCARLVPQNLLHLLDWHHSVLAIHTKTQWFVQWHLSLNPLAVPDDTWIIVPCAVMVSVTISPLGDGPVGFIANAGTTLRVSMSVATEDVANPHGAMEDVIINLLCSNLALKNCMVWCKSVMQRGRGCKW